MTENAKINPWSRLSLDIGQEARWTIGPLRLYVQRHEQEWRAAYERQDDEETADFDVLTPVPIEDPELDLAYERFLVKETTEFVRLRPMPADRPVVAQPAGPFRILPGENVTIFISSPLWLRIEVGDPGRPLMEVPVQRPSDTWFGPSTRVGELCYASQTAGRLSLEEIPFRPHRAVTAVNLDNRAETPLLFERLSLPVNMLTLYGTASRFLWTQDVTVVRKDGQDQADVRIGDGPSTHAQDPVPLSEPREAATRGGLVRTLTSLFT